MRVEMEFDECIKDLLSAEESYVRSITDPNDSEGARYMDREYYISKLKDMFKNARNGEYNETSNSS